MNIYGEPILPFNIISCITDLIGYNKLIIVIWDLSSLHQQECHCLEILVYHSQSWYILSEEVKSGPFDLEWAKSLN